MSNKSIKDPILERLRDFISEQLSVRRESLAPSTRIQEDLGCTGDDAVELMQAFAKQFSVDLRALNLKEYFDEEGFDPIGYVLSLFRKCRIARRSALTLEDLVNAARAGKWPDNR
jgi:acyl carrier protein